MPEQENAMSGLIISRIPRLFVAGVMVIVCFAIQAEADEAAVSKVASAGVQSVIHVDDSLLSLGYLNIAVATIDSIKSEQWRDQFPPLPVGQLKISEQIRGKMPGSIHFVPLLYGTPAYEKQSPEQMNHWKGYVLNEFVGKKWILITNGVNVLAAYPFSEQLRAYIKSHMASEGPGDMVLLLLAMLIVGLTAVSRMSGKIGTWAPMVLLIMQLGIYAFYESNTPAYYNMRIDLLFIIPAIILNLVLTMRYYGHRTSTDNV